LKPSNSENWLWGNRHVKDVRTTLNQDSIHPAKIFSFLFFITWLFKIVVVFADFFYISLFVFPFQSFNFFLRHSFIMSEFFNVYIKK
jgi:hypothetical protein